MLTRSAYLDKFFAHGLGFLELANRQAYWKQPGDAKKKSKSCQRQGLKPSFKVKSGRCEPMSNLEKLPLRSRQVPANVRRACCQERIETDRLRLRNAEAQKDKLGLLSDRTAVGL